MTAHYWTPKMLHRFRTLNKITPVLSFKAIAEIMSAEFKLPLTRNAMIGKAHRLGLPDRRTGAVRPPIVGKGKPMPAKKVAIDAPIPPIEALLPDLVLRTGITIYQLRDSTCHWPVTAGRPPFLYCGHPVKGERSYCPKHCEIGYTTARVGPKP